MKRLVGRLRGRVQSRSESAGAAEPDVTADPTPIRISKRARTALILAVLVLLGLVIWRVPSVLTTVVGGFALALALSFPVRWLSRFMPRGLAILLSFLILVGLVVLGALYLVPLAGRQIASLANTLPDIANTVERYLRDALNFFQDRNLLPSDPEQVASGIRDRLTNAARTLAGNLLGGALNVVTGTVSFAITLFGVIFVGAYLLIDVRRFKAAYLRAAHRRYRRDFLTLWDAFGRSLSRYLGGSPSCSP